MSLEKNNLIKFVEIEKLAPHPRNPNTHSQDQIERLAKIINYQGFRVPIIVSKLSGFIVAGHGRLEAAKLMGLTRVPVFYQDFEDDKQELAFMTSDNAIAEWAKLDLSGLKKDLQKINFDLDLDFLGFKEFGFFSEEPDQEPETEKESKDKKFILEIEFDSEQDLKSYYDDFVENGYIAKIK